MIRNNRAMITVDLYSIYYCPTHKIYIHYIINKNYVGICWDCLRLSNKL